MAKTDLAFDEFLNLMQVESYKSGVLRTYFEELLIKKTRDLVRQSFVGSTYMKRHFAESFWPVFAEKTLKEAKALHESSDYDIALKLDSFVLEALSSSLPTMKLKEAPDGEEYGTQRLLKTVYTLSVKDLVECDDGLFAKAADQIYRPRGVYRESLFDDTFLNRQVELLFVTDLKKVQNIWSAIPADLYVKSLWKKSPTFIGAEALKGVFQTFEALVDNPFLTGKAYKTNTLDVMWEPQAVAPVPGQILPVIGGVAGDLIPAPVWEAWNNAEPGILDMDDVMPAVAA